MRIVRTVSLVLLIGLANGQSLFHRRLDLKGALPLPTTGCFLYYSFFDRDEIRRFSLDTGEEQVLERNLGANSLALAVHDGKVYYERTEGTRKLLVQADANGANAVDVYDTDANDADDIGAVAVDTVNNRLYVTDYNGQRILRTDDLEGSNPTVILDTIGSLPAGIAVTGNKVYFVTQGLNSFVARMNLDGTGLETIVADPKDFRLAIDVDAGKLYWTEQELPLFSIQRSNLDGSDREDFLVQNDPIISLMVQDGVVYFAAKQGNGDSTNVLRSASVGSPPVFDELGTIDGNVAFMDIGCE